MADKGPAVLAEHVETQIVSLRGQKVMLDRDLAALYGLESKALNHAVKRNIDRLSADFMFWLTLKAAEVLRSQVVTLKKDTDVPGLCTSAQVEEVRRHGHVLTPGRYVGAEAQQDYGELFDERFARLRRQLEEQFAESARLEAQVREDTLRLTGTG